MNPASRYIYSSNMIKGSNADKCELIRISIFHFMTRQNNNQSSKIIQLESVVIPSHINSQKLKKKNCYAEFRLTDSSF
jgi:hypothetical protein